MFNLFNLFDKNNLPVKSPDLSDNKLHKLLLNQVFLPIIWINQMLAYNIRKYFNNLGRKQYRSLNFICFLSSLQETRPCINQICVSTDIIFSLKRKVFNK